MRVLGITEIARTACELLEWKRPSGGLKNAECRRLIEQLSGEGLLRLPERRGAGAPGRRRVARTKPGEPQAEIHGSAGEFAPLRLEVVRGGPADRSGNHALFKELLDRYHYLGYRVPFGANLRYLVRSQRAPEKVLACLLWSSPAWRMAARESWIGWSDEERARNLQLVVNNGRFLIPPWVRVKGLASKILAACARQLPGDWEKLYGYRPLLLETLGGCRTIPRDLLPGGELDSPGPDHRAWPDGPQACRAGESGEGSVRVPAVPPRAAAVAEQHGAGLERTGGRG